MLDEKEEELKNLRLRVEGEKNSAHRFWMRLKDREKTIEELREELKTEMKRKNRWMEMAEKGRNALNDLVQKHNEKLKND